MIEAGTGSQLLSKHISDKGRNGNVGQTGFTVEEPATHYRAAHAVDRNETKGTGQEKKSPAGRTRPQLHQSLAQYLSWARRLFFKEGLTGKGLCGQGTVRLPPVPGRQWQRGAWCLVP
jgi:hypothetical protein